MQNSFITQNSFIDSINNYFILVLIVGLLIYFIPCLIAGMREHKYFYFVAIINLVLGWTFLGWIAALMWAVNNDIEKNN